jgi:outer membrane lipoprotein-sorting protein
MKFWTAILVSGVLACSVSCGGAKPQATAPAQAAEVKTENYDEAINAAKAAPHDGLVAAFQRATEMQAFRAKLESTSDGRMSTIQYEFVAPDRYRMANGPTEMIVVGEQAYIKTMGAWQKVATGAGEKMKAIRSAELAVQAREATNVNFMQSDTLNGEPTVVYSYIATKIGAASGTSNNKTWVSLKDGLPRKTEFLSNFGGFSSKGVMTWYDYNGDVKIEPPLK